MSSLHIPSEDELENCIFVLYIVNSNTKLLGVLDLLKLYSPPPPLCGEGGHSPNAMGGVEDVPINETSLPEYTPLVGVYNWGTGYP